VSVSHVSVLTAVILFAWCAGLRQQRVLMQILRTLRATKGKLMCRKLQQEQSAGNRRGKTEQLVNATSLPLTD